MTDNIICVIVGPTSEESVKSISGQCETFHLTETKQPWPHIVFDGTANIYKTAINFAKSKKKDYLYIMSGFSVIHNNCIKRMIKEESDDYVSIFSSYRVFLNNSTDSKMVVETLMSHNYYEILKTTQNIKNILVNINNVNEEEYINPYHIMLANSIDNISYHIPEALYDIPYTEYKDTNDHLINNIKANYAKLYLQR